MLEVVREPFGRTPEFSKMGLLACDDQVAAAGEVTFNCFFANDALDAIN
jgi:hypothetical protein